VTARQRGAGGDAEPYDPSDFPAFAVTVDVVVLTVTDGRLQVLLIERGADPFAGQWALPGGFKHPDETLDEAAGRELAEETGVEAAQQLAQFGAYGDPDRDPRMNVVSVAYLGVMREVGRPIAGTDAAEARLWPVAEVLGGAVDLAFDHERILTDAVERARSDLETTSLATAFVGPTFTMTELRNVFEELWGEHLDPGNFSRSLTRRPDWIEATGERRPPGPEGGKPAELYSPGEAWGEELGSPVRRSRKPTKPRPSKPKRPKK
jgi:8-oxo-dGTP diphosphatase